MIRDVKEGTREPYRGGKALLRDGYGGSVACAATSHRKLSLGSCLAST